MSSYLSFLIVYVAFNNDWPCLLGCETIDPSCKPAGHHRLGLCWGWGQIGPAGPVWGHFGGILGVPCLRSASWRAWPAVTSSLVGCLGLAESGALGSVGSQNPCRECRDCGVGRVRTDPPHAVLSVTAWHSQPLVLAVLSVLPAAPAPLPAYTFLPSPAHRCPHTGDLCLLSSANLPLVPCFPTPAQSVPTAPTSTPPAATSAAPSSLLPGRCPAAGASWWRGPASSVHPGWMRWPLPPWT